MFCGKLSAKQVTAVYRVVAQLTVRRSHFEVASSQSQKDQSLPKASMPTTGTPQSAILKHANEHPNFDSAHLYWFIYTFTGESLCKMRYLLHDQRWKYKTTDPKEPSKMFMESIYNCKGKFLVWLYCSLSLSRHFFGTTANCVSITITTKRRLDATRKDVYHHWWDGSVKNKPTISSKKIKNRSKSLEVEVQFVMS